MLSRARRNCRRANSQNIGVGARCVRTRKTSSWIVARVDCSAAAILDYTRRIQADVTTGSNGEGIRYVQKRRKKKRKEFANFIIYGSSESLRRIVFFLKWMNRGFIGDLWWKRVPHTRGGYRVITWTFEWLTRGSIDEQERCFLVQLSFSVRELRPRDSCKTLACNCGRLVAFLNKLIMQRTEC